MNKESITESLRKFVERRDDLLHEDAVGFSIHLSRFMEFCENDELILFVMKPLLIKNTPDVDLWWNQLSNIKNNFPGDSDEELVLRYLILKSANENPNKIYNFGFAFGKYKLDKAVDAFRTIIIRPLTNELSERISKASNIVTPEERALQAVPLIRIPRSTEIRIFLSHKSVDKPIITRYYNALSELGFEPWFDQPDMPAGTNLERGILDGFEKSCAAIFFITNNFIDESYLAAEVDYAITQKRKKDKKFAIITLRFPDARPVPGLLTPYIYKEVQNDLEGFFEVIRALPIELGQARWKKGIE